MTSVIHYKFKAAAGAWSQITFEGSSLSVQQAKDAIIVQKKLNKQGGQDFDLRLSNAQTSEGQSHTLIPHPHHTPLTSHPLHCSTVLRVLHSSHAFFVTPLSLSRLPV
jgi:hypothetical protein